MTSFLLGLRMCKLNLQYRKQCELETVLLRPQKGFILITSLTYGKKKN